MNRRTFLKSLGVVGVVTLFFPKVFFFLEQESNGSATSADIGRYKCFWVGKNGKDSNPGTGTYDKPLATIGEAVKRIDEGVPRENNVVFILPGRGVQPHLTCV